MRLQARAYLMDCFVKQGDYDFLPEGVLEEMTDRLMSLDEDFMQRSGVNDGAVYDDDEAGAFLQKGMREAFPEFSMYMMRLVDDYLDFHEDYLASVDGIEWDCEV